MTRDTALIYVRVSRLDGDDRPRRPTRGILFA